MELSTSYPSASHPSSHYPYPCYPILQDLRFRLNIHIANTYRRTLSEEQEEYLKTAPKRLFTFQEQAMIKKRIIVGDFEIEAYKSLVSEIDFVLERSTTVIFPGQRGEREEKAQHLIQECLLDAREAKSDYNKYMDRYRRY